MCRNIDQCLMNVHGCQHVCVNTAQPGGFRCECNSGYELNHDNRTCSGMLIYFELINYYLKRLNIIMYILGTILHFFHKDIEFLL